ncbi:MAG: zinc ABC transporter substrate-binding protein [Phycisphaeraceae bacterium]|nr:zinc ABC transporter substrate-binding protein [Phycisphaeraceae bacterium]
MRHGWSWSAPAWAAFRLVVALIAGGLVAACSRTAGEGSSPPADGQSGSPLSVVATTGMIADVARNVAGDRAAVTALMGEGVDPHMYKASPGDVRLLTSADLVLYNGLHLEGRMADVLVKMAQRHPTVQVTDAIPEDRLREPPEFQGHFDPHVWFDVSLWMLATERTRDALIEIDPAGKPGYNERSAAYLEELARLDAWARERIATIPADRRVLVTAHDAFGYFGRAYGMEVRAIQGISTDSEASMRDINALVDMLVKDRIPAVFVESSVPRKTIEALVEGARARGHNVKIGGELFSDAMGPSGTPEGTYIGMVRHNVDVIVAALAEPAR